MREAKLPVAGVLIAGVLTCGSAGAEYLDEPFETPEPERRHGFSVALSGGLSVFAAQGSANEADQIGVAEHQSSTGLGLSSGGGLWIGGAITDWLTLSVGLFGGDMSKRGLEGGGGTFLVRVETFPLFFAGGSLRDFGIALNAGAGGMSLERDGETAIEAQGSSAIGLSAFHETFRFWHLGMGPQLDYLHQFSDSAGAHQLVLGWRTAFYAGP